MRQREKTLTPGQSCRFAMRQRSYVELRLDSEKETALEK